MSGLKTTKMCSGMFETLLPLFIAAERDTRKSGIVKLLDHCSVGIFVLIVKVLRFFKIF